MKSESGVSVLADGRQVQEHVQVLEAVPPVGHFWREMLRYATGSTDQLTCGGVDLPALRPAAVRKVPQCGT